MATLKKNSSPTSTSRTTRRIRACRNSRTRRHPDLEEAAATGLAAGRAAIIAHARHAPTAPGVYRMLDRAGEVLYVGKAKNIRKRVVAYARPTGHDTRIERMIAATARLEFVSTATETEALLLEANLIKRLRPRFNVLMRDDKSFPYILITEDHAAPQIMKHRGARNRPGDYYGPFASAQAVHRTITALRARVPDPLLLGRRVRQPHAPLPAASDQALLGALHRRDRAGRLRRAGAARPRRSSPAAARRCAQQLARDMEAAAAALDFERAAAYRDRLAALSAIQAHQGINPRGVAEADVFAAHQQGGFTCIQVFFFRTGQNWGNRAYFPKADRSLSAAEVLGSFLAQFYDDKPCPPLRPRLARRRRPRAARRGAHDQERASGGGRGAAARRDARTWSSMRSPMRARRSGASSPKPPRSSGCSPALAEAFGLPRAPQRIEVYDNSHIQGTQRGRRDDRRRAGRLPQEPVPQVQHPRRGARARRRLRHDARGAHAPVQAAARRGAARSGAGRGRRRTPDAGADAARANRPGPIWC